MLNKPYKGLILCLTGLSDKYKYQQELSISICREIEANITKASFKTTCLICTKNCEKNCTLKLDTNTYSSLENNIQEMAKSQKTNSYICKSCHAEVQQKWHVCVVTDICRNIYVKCTTK